MAQFKFHVIEFGGIYKCFDVTMAHGFRVLHRLPKCWKEVSWCRTEHGQYNSGSTKIYQSKNTGKYYFVRYFDGCLNEMYAEVVGVDWIGLEDKVKQIRRDSGILNKGLEKEERSRLLSECLTKIDKMVSKVVA